MLLCIGRVYLSPVKLVTAADVGIARWLLLELSSNIAGDVAR